MVGRILSFVAVNMWRSKPRCRQWSRNSRMTRLTSVGRFLPQAGDVPAPVDLPQLRARDGLGDPPVVARQRDQVLSAVHDQRRAPDLGRRWSASWLMSAPRKQRPVGVLGLAPGDAGKVVLQLGHAPRARRPRGTEPTSRMRRRRRPRAAPSPARAGAPGSGGGCGVERVEDQVESSTALPTSSGERTRSPGEQEPRLKPTMATPERPSARTTPSTSRDMSRPCRPRRGRRSRPCRVVDGDEAVVVGEVRQQASAPTRGPSCRRRASIAWARPVPCSA